MLNAGKWVVEIKKNRHVGNWNPGQRIEMSEVDANGLIKDGYAVLISRPTITQAIAGKVNDVLSHAPMNRSMDSPIKRSPQNNVPLSNQE